MEVSDADECYYMNGGILIYVSTIGNKTLSYKQLILNEIIRIMDDSKLDSVHPSVVYISYHHDRDTTTQEISSSVRGQDTVKLLCVIEVTSSTNVVPIAIGAGASGFLFLFGVFYRYRYYIESTRVVGIKNSQGSPTTTDLSNFVEVPLSRL